jgi:hypothetical protein
MVLIGDQGGEVNAAFDILLASEAGALFAGLNKYRDLNLLSLGLCALFTNYTR